jgi:hypothetical protein
LIIHELTIATQLCDIWDKAWIEHIRLCLTKTFFFFFLVNLKLRVRRGKQNIQKKSLAKVIEAVQGGIVIRPRT